MATDLPVTNGDHRRSGKGSSHLEKDGLARMLKGGVIMDVVNAEQVLSPHLSPTHSLLHT